jgi:hypothetical protein
MKESSDNKRVFNGEVAIHFPGIKGLDIPVVWVFPKLKIYLNSGVAQFETPESVLQVLRDRSRYLDWARVVEQSKTKDIERDKTFPQRKNAA